MLDKIYIPTFRRADIQITYDNLPDEYKEKVIMVVQEQERKDYNYDVKYFEVDNDIGIAKTRELICRDAKKTRFLMVDDDIVFHRRNQKYYSAFDKVSNMDKSKRIATNSDLDDMFTLFNEWMDDGMLHVGCRRSDLPPVKTPHSDIVFIQGAHFINGEMLSDIIEEIDWTYCKVGEDAHFMLEYLIRGYNNRRSDEFTFSAKSFQEGGCSVFRDAEFHNKEHEKLMSKWPEYVSLRKEIQAQGSHGHKIGVIKEFSYKPKRARRLFLQKNGAENDPNVTQPKKQFQPEIDKRVKK